MRAAVVGCGSWGTAFARLLALEGHDTLLLCRDGAQADGINRFGRNPRSLRDVALPAQLAAAPLEGTPLDDVELLVLAVPSRAFAAVAREAVPRTPSAVLLSLAKGLDPAGPRRLSEVLCELAPAERVAVLSGPNHAEEVAADQPTASVVASSDGALARRLQGAITGRNIRVYASDDVAGVELCAAAKNVIALAAGVSDGLGFGDNAKAALITRGMAEMYRLGSGFGAQVRTYAGLAGMGDLVATCTSGHSRNRRAGELLARGVPAGWIEAQIGQVVEGLDTAPALRDLAAAHGIELPITCAVCEVATGAMTPLEAVRELMSREPTEE